MRRSRTFFKGKGEGDGWQLFEFELVGPRHIFWQFYDVLQRNLNFGQRYGPPPSPRPLL